jgi:hypothetical protein
MTKQDNNDILVFATTREYHTASPADGIDDENDDNKFGQSIRKMNETYLQKPVK